MPCIGHSINLVGEFSAKECLCATSFIHFLQLLYNFFTCSTHRWEVLRDICKAHLHSLPSTRWSRRSDAERDLRHHYDGIYQALIRISNDTKDVRHEASCLAEKFTLFENAFMTVFWYAILTRFDSVSKCIQRVELDLCTANDMLLSLLEFVKKLREDFSKFGKEAKNLSKCVVCEYSDSKKRKIIKKLPDGYTTTDELSGARKFQVDALNVIIDKIIVEMESRIKAYSDIVSIFDFLMKLHELKDDLLEIKVKNLVKIYSNDSNDNIFHEFKQFIELLKINSEYFYNGDTQSTTRRLNPLKVLNFVEFDLIDVFPNVYLAYRIFVTIPIANCKAERSFSTLKRIKNVLRSKMSDNRSSALARLTIECELMKNINFEELIQMFASQKCRKKTLSFSYTMFFIYFVVCFCEFYCEKLKFFPVILFLFISK